MLEAFALLVLIAGTVFWIDSLRAREAALMAGRAACERYSLLLLDDTVAVTRLRLARNAEGRLRIARRYGFEFSDTGNNRRRGAISLLGSLAEDIAFEPYATDGDAVNDSSNDPAPPRLTHLTRVK